jgi:hypothetical protein
MEIQVSVKGENMINQKIELMYIELKTGYSDNGPAWIGKVKYSKSGQTVYFNNKGFKRFQGINSNFYDIETGEEYWISGVKKNGEDRHWAGNGKIMIDRKVIDEYLIITGESQLNTKRLEVIELKDEFPVERINTFLNKK